MPQIILNAAIKYLTLNPQVVENLLNQILPVLFELIAAEIQKAAASAKTGA
jgi:hypothetical protein